MKTLWLAGCLLLMGTTATFAQLYSRAYGDSTKPAVIFLHGGPGYNCAGFELSTAQPLADRGYYVVVYDQRGCGRSKAVSGAYTMAEAIADLRGIYDQYRLRKATLLGHSWGGTVGIGFARQWPGYVANLVLVSSPVSYPQTFRAILAHCRKVYTDQQSPMLKSIDALEKTDTASFAYASFAFFHAMNAKLYTPAERTDARKQLYETMTKSPAFALLAQSSFEPVNGFFQNEHYTTLNLTGPVRALRMPVFGIYGDEDGLFDAGQLATIRQLTGPQRFVLIAGASHNVFIDQQPAFLTAVDRFVGGR